VNSQPADGRSENRFMTSITRRITAAEASTVAADDRAIKGSVDRGDWLTKGDRGHDVEGLQRGLKARGLYRGPIDGVFGDVTKDAVMGFQRQQGIVADGAVGPQTAKAMRQSQVAVGDHFEQPAHLNQAGKDILGVEKKLRRLGYDTGKVDGVFDQKTMKAVRGLRKADPTLSDKRSDINGRFEKKLNEAVAHAPPPPPPTPTETTLKQFDRTGPGADYHHVNFRGVEMNRRTQKMVERADFIMQKKYGHAGFNFQFVQGSYSHSVSASAGTHDGGGALDVRDSGLPRATVDDMVKSLRQAGFAAWSRGRGHDSFGPHIHAIAIGDAQMSSSARTQIGEYARGENGLANHARDPDAGLGRPVPTWAKRFL
jgi:hypothetical protein